MYVRNCWYVAGWCTEFPRGRPVAITMLDEPLVFYRTSSGSLAALEDRCVHRLAPLSHGQIEGDDLRCMYHGLKFASSGRCVEVPGQAAVPQAACVRSYPVIERHSVVWVWMGDVRKQDAALIPDFIGVDDPNWAMRSGRMDYQADYRLIQDNLLDLTHIAYVHRASFGAGNPKRNQAWASAQVHVTQLARGVRVERWIQDVPPPAHLVEEAGSAIDVWTTYDYLIPGIFLLTTSNYRPGAAQRSGAAVRPAEEPLFSNFTCQAVTPLTRKTTCYFFGFGPWSKATRALELKETFYELGNKAFTEDRLMIEAQQRIIDADPSRKMLLLGFDKAPAMYGRLVEALLKAEAES